MVGDRQEKYKREAALKKTDTTDPSSSAALLRGKITKLLEQAEIATKQLANAEGSTIDITADDFSPQSIIDQSFLPDDNS